MSDGGRVPAGRRRLVRALVVTAVVLLGLAVVTMLAVVSVVRGVRDPNVGPLPDRADAIVVFAGEGQRHRLGRELAADGLAPVVVVSLGSQYRELDDVCGQTEPFEVWCVDPSTTENTRGEAQMFGRLAAENRWRSVVGVTGEYHVQRARTYLDRCFGGELSFAAVPWRGTSERVIRHETLGGIQARFLTFRC